MTSTKTVHLLVDSGTMARWTAIQEGLAYIFRFWLTVLVTFRHTGSDGVGCSLPPGELVIE